MVLFKLAALAAGMMLVISTLLTAHYGRLCAKHRREGFLDALEKHEKEAKLLFWVTCGAIIAIELMVRFNGGIAGNPIFPIHLIFALPFFISMTVMRFWVNGLRHPQAHRLLAIVCLTNFVGTIITGAILLWYC